MEHQQVKDLQTEIVRTKNQIAQASRLSKYYSLDYITVTELNTLINNDWWCQAELLSDLVKEPGLEVGKRTPVCFLLLTEINFKKKGKYIDSELSVSCFSPAPWFDLEVAVSWTDFRIKRALEELNNRCSRIFWPVYDRNLELQCLLRDKGYTVNPEEYMEEAQKFIFTK